MADISDLIDEKLNLFDEELSQMHNAEDTNQNEIDASRYSKYAVDYKKNLSKSFLLVSGKEISSKLADQLYWATKKIDGELRYIQFDGKKSFMFTSGGNLCEELPCMTQLTQVLTSRKINWCVICAELAKIDPSGRRTRVGDVIHALADKNEKQKLVLMPFDYGGLEDENYKARWNRLNELFGNEEERKMTSNLELHPLVFSVPFRECSNLAELQKVYDDWVAFDPRGKSYNAEGLVVHGVTPVIYKIKPQHELDAVCTGYTLLDDGSGVRDLLFATREKSGLFRIVGCGGNGLTNDQRRELKARFELTHTESTYTHIDSRGIAYQMIKPQTVFELGIIDYGVELSDASPVRNPLLSFSESNGFLLQCHATGASCHSLTIIRERQDKNASYEYIRTAQITDIVPFAPDPALSLKNLPKSEVVSREVYKKESSSRTCVRKFVIWRTNKSKNPLFPAFVMQYTDFSSARADCLKKELRISNSLQQILELTEAMKEKYITTGWEKVV